MTNNELKAVAWLVGEATTCCNQDDEGMCIDCPMRCGFECASASGPQLESAKDHIARVIAEKVKEYEDE